MSVKTNFVKWFSVFLLLALACLIVLERLHTYNEPLERDITTYALIGDGLLKGRQLYSDLWDCKPPALYFSFAAAEVLNGYGPSSIFLLNIFFSILTLIAVFMAGLWGSGWAAGIWAALFWSVISGDLYFQANQPNTEVFVNAALALAFFLWIRLRDSAGCKIPILLGLISLLASLYKQPSVLSFLALGIVSFFLCSNRASRNITFRKILVPGSILAGGWALIAVYFIGSHRWVDFQYAVFFFNFIYNYYQAASLQDFFNHIKGSNFGPHFAEFLLPLLLLSCWGAYRQKKEKYFLWVLWFSYLFSILPQILGSGHYPPHYYQLLFPPLVIGGAWGAAEMGGSLKKTLKSLVFLPGGLVLAILVLHEIPFYLEPAQTWSEWKYGDLFLQSCQVGKEINRMLKPGETFYEWGNETGIYYYSLHFPSSGIFFSYPLLKGPMAGNMTRRVIQDLEKNKPELFILPITDMVSTGIRHPVLEWFRDRYRHVPNRPHRGMFLLFMRKGGELEKRLLQKSRL